MAKEMNEQTRCPVHPGSVIREYMGDTLTVTELAAHLQIAEIDLSHLLNGHGGVSADLAFRLSEALGTTPELWLNMQANYDQWRAAAQAKNDRHRGSGRPLSPATPPDMRVRIRRFGRIELFPSEQPRESKLVEVCDGKRETHSGAVGHTPATVATCRGGGGQRSRNTQLA